MRITFAHLCDYASISKEGKLSVNGIFEGINAPQMPFRHSSMFVVFCIEVRRSEVDKVADVLIELRDEDGGLVVKAQAKLQVNKQPPAPHDHVSLPQLVNLAGLSFPKAGTYTWSIFLNRHLGAELPLRVALVKPPKGAES